MLAAQTVQHLERLLGGDPETEQAVLAFIRHKWGVHSLVYLSEAVAREIIRRPYDFTVAAKRFHQPDLF